MLIQSTTQLEKSTGNSKLEREKLLRAGTLHWIHWCVVTLSVLLTIGAWWFSTTQIQEKISNQFERESDQIVELISERMQKYEDALWGGVGALAIQGGEVSAIEWKTFARTLSIDVKYPGINGIGVIERIEPFEFDSYIEMQRKDRPNFSIFPKHQKSEYLPIVYIEPIENNYKALGLDMAHEKHRYDAALKARDTGAARITAPIVLVQDSKKTPGFLFFAPFYHMNQSQTLQQRQQNFAGLVYAPFIVSKLMEGVLAKHKRRVGIKISDEIVLYDEIVKSSEDFDPHPLFRQQKVLEIYGRNWNIDIRSSLSFRTSAGNNQPLVILIGGLIIDVLLFTLFVLLSRANRYALRYADLATSDLNRAYQREQRAREVLEKAQSDLRTQSERLKTSNRELQEFASIAAHDLQEPLRKIQGFGDRIEQMYAEELPKQALHYFSRMQASARRMSVLINDILTFSRVSAQDVEFETIDLDQLVREIVAELSDKLEETGGSIKFEGLEPISGNGLQLRQLFRNLLWNSLKYRRSEVPPLIKIQGKMMSNGSSHQSIGEAFQLEISDNGIGFEEKYAEKIFVIFQRLHGKAEYEGTGIGLALCRKIVENHKGSIVANSCPGEGSIFRIVLPVSQRKRAAA